MKIKLAFALLVVPALAWAQPKTPEDWWKEGETQYNLGNFEEAVKAFKQGFALETKDSKKSAYLYNIAQAYRLNKDCSNAQFFYKRYLALKENDTTKPLRPAKRAEIEEHIKRLELCAQQQEAIRQPPPDQNLNTRPDGDPDTEVEDKDKSTDPDTNKAKDKLVGDTGEDGEEDDGEDGEEDGVVAKASAGPSLISARLGGGGAVIATGDVEVPVQATGALIAGYPISLGAMATVELGAGFTFTPVPYDSASTGMSGTAQFISAVANVGATYHVAPKIGVRGDLGLGALFLTGASGSPFTEGAPTSGALTMFHVRVGLGADFAITPNVLATVMPAFSYSPPKAGLDPSIKAITAIDLMVGLGYRM